jgi:hypothetical protein
VVREVVAGLGLTFAQAARTIPPGRRGKTTAPSTFWRWAKKGVLVAGRAVKLEVCRVGCRWMTSRPALERFFAALSQLDGAAAEAPPRQTQNKPNRSRQRQAQVQRAQQELDRLGL